MSENVNEWTNSKYIVDGEEALKVSFYSFEKPDLKTDYIGLRIVRNK